jgi:hypothetical protein
MPEAKAMAKKERLMMGAAAVGLTTLPMAKASATKGNAPRARLAISVIYWAALNCTPPTKKARPLRSSNVVRTESKAVVIFARR